MEYLQPRKVLCFPGVQGKYSVWGVLMYRACLVNWRSPYDAFVIIGSHNVWRQATIGPNAEFSLPVFQETYFKGLFCIKVFK